MTKEEFLQTIRSYCAFDLPYWYPLNSINIEVPFIAYDLDRIYKDHQIDRVAQVLAVCSIASVTVFQNQDNHAMPETMDLGGLLYERDRGGYTFPWFIECYYYDVTKQWMIYVSHEGTITFAGTEIVKAAKKHIDEKYLYPC